MRSLLGKNGHKEVKSDTMIIGSGSDLRFSSRASKSDRHGLHEASRELQQGCLGYPLGEQLAVDQSFEPVVPDKCNKARLSP